MKVFVYGPRSVINNEPIICLGFGDEDPSPRFPIHFELISTPLCELPIPQAAANQLRGEQMGSIYTHDEIWSVFRTPDGCKVIVPDTRLTIGIDGEPHTLWDKAVRAVSHYRPDITTGLSIERSLSTFRAGGTLADAIDQMTANRLPGDLMANLTGYYGVARNFPFPDYVTIHFTDETDYLMVSANL